ncbi:MAG: YolD-like family protein [Oscillospiraceae bacterium]|nr:YolD-like family protein [Oscillospiraceae bacterium]
MRNPYEDIINLPHHVSKTHPQMSMQDRAAQFSPFAALTGYDDAIDETARLTGRKIELGEEAKEILDRKLQYLRSIISEQPEISVTYFVPDEKKDGGEYVTVSGNLKRIDEYERVMVLTDGEVIRLDDVIDIQL